MNIRKRFIYIFCVIIVFFLLFNTKSYAGTQKWNSLNYDVTVNLDGSMDVIETWDIDISETNTLFKDFDIDNSKYSGITDVKVSRIEENEIPLTQIYEEQYHVNTGCYYALPISSSKYEIAWNVGLDNTKETRTYKIYYTIKDAIKIYNDCTELYWMFLGTDNSISGKNITGTIKLPQNVINIEKLRVWAHGPLTGNIEKVSNNEVKFSVPSLLSNEMIEVRVVTEDNIYEESGNFYNVNKLNTILEEEQEWANKANLTRKMYKVYYLIAIIILVGTLIIFYKKMRKYIKSGEELIEKYKFDVPEIEYYREIPDESNATPSRVVYLRNLKRSVSYMTNDISKIFSATILDLSIKGLIEFEPIDNKDFRIIVKNKTSELPLDEEYVYNLLLDACRKKGDLPNSITSKEFSKYAKKNYDEFYYIRTKFEVTAKKYQKDCGNIDSQRVTEVKEWENLASIYILILSFGMIFGVFSLPIIASGLLQCGLIIGAFGIAFLLGSIVNLIAIGKVNKKISILSKKGYIEKMQWEALEKYMKDYSLLKEKQVFDIVLWEKFLVYATAFGISKKVIEQLKIVHPEAFISNDNYNTHYGYWYLISNRSFGENSFNNLNNIFEGAYMSAQSAYNIAHSAESSGSGGGGGFSSGGGGRRRSAEAAADANEI